MKKMKTRAYYKDKNGVLKMITAFGVWHKEMAEPGWRKRKFFSTHPPGERFPMHHKRRKNGTSYFAYNPIYKKLAERLGGGESLAHYLFKTAISELKSSELRTGYHHPRVKIIFKNLCTEKEIVHNGKKYYIDIFGKFESDSPLQLKWGGLIGIEVCHCHPVEQEREKMATFRALELPVVQIKISDKLLYKTPEDKSTPKKEREYIEFLKPYLTDYMGVNILSNPSTKEYLQAENSSLKSELTALKKQLESEKQRCAVLDDKNKVLSIELEDKKNHIDQLSKEARRANEDLEGVKSMNVIRFFFKKQFGW
jgi:hypothetical protein